MVATLILEALRTVAYTFASLFPIINPLGVAPIFLSLTAMYPAAVRKQLSRKIAVYGFVILGCSLTLGSAVLAFFGVSLNMIQVAGGFVLANTGWSMSNQKKTDGAGHEPNTIEGALQRAFYPLTLPLTVGPGCISVAVAFGAHIRQQSTEARIDNVPPFIGALIGMALVCVTIAVCYEHAGRLEKLLGPSGTSVVARLSAFLLLAMGVQLMWNGLMAAVTTFVGQSPRL